MSEKSKNKKARIILMFIIIILIPAIWFLFLNKGSDRELASKKLTGKWLRYDGTYMIEIQKVNPDGTLNAAYFNPNPIKVGIAQWKFKGDKLNIMVELTDKDYDGSNYLLSYDEESGKLVGLYYQAVAKQTYEVSFNKQ